MKEFVEKLIKTFKCEELRTELIAVGDVISIVNQLAEEHNNKSTDISTDTSTELIEKINFAIEVSNTNDNYMTGLRNGMRYCLALIDGKEPEFENCNQDSTKNNQGWIPCSERLPEESLNSVIGWDEYRKCCCFVQYYGGRWVLGNDVEIVKITAWQPLPEPYKV